MAWFANQATFGLDRAWKLVTELVAQLRWQALSGGEGTPPPVSAHNYRRKGGLINTSDAFRGEDFRVIRELANGQVPVAKDLDLLLTALTVGRAGHDGRKEAMKASLAKFLEKGVGVAPEPISKRFLELWKGAARKVGERWVKFLTESSHISLSQTASTDYSRGDGGKPAEFQNKFIREFLLRPSRNYPGWSDTVDFRGKPLCPGGCEPEEERAFWHLPLGAVLYRKREEWLEPPSGMGDYLGDQVILWAYTDARQYFKTSGQKPLFCDLSCWDPDVVQESWEITHHSIPCRVFTVSEGGAKARTANTEPLSVSLVGQAVRRVVDRALFRSDNRAAWEEPTAWNTFVGLRAWCSQHEAEVAAWEVVEVGSTDLVGASDRLHPDLLKIQVEERGRGLPSSHWYNRIYGAVALSHRVLIVTEEISALTGYPVGSTLQQRGTCLGSPTSFAELSSYLLVSEEAAAYRYLELSPGGRKSTALPRYYGEVVGDDEIVVAEPLFLSTLSWVKRQSQQEESVGKSFRGTIPRNGRSVGIFLEDCIEFTRENSLLRVRYIDTIKLRMMVARGAPVQLPAYKRSDPIFSRMRGVANRIEYMRGDNIPSWRFYTELTWKEFGKRLWRSHEGFPYFLPQEFSGLGAPVLGGWHDAVFLTHWHYLGLCILASQDEDVRGAVTKAFGMDAHLDALQSELLAADLNIGTAEILESPEAALNLVVNHRKFTAAPERYKTSAGKWWKKGFHKELAKVHVYPYLTVLDTVKKKAALQLLMFGEPATSTTYQTLVLWRTRWSDLSKKYMTGLSALSTDSGGTGGLINRFLREYPNKDVFVQRLRPEWNWYVPLDGELSTKHFLEVNLGND